VELWGRVVSGSLVVIAAVFGVVGALVAEARVASLAIAAISLAVALFGVPRLVRLFSSFTGDERLLEHGLPAQATLTAVNPTGWRYNRTYPIVRFGLRVQHAGGPQPAEIRQVVEPDLLPRLVPGAVVGVRVDPADPARVVIDWRMPVQGPDRPA